MAAPKGFQPPNAPKGRKKGQVNKVTASVKAALTEAFDLKGGVPSLLAWASKPENETAFYALWAKMLPTEVDVTSGGESLAVLMRAAEQRVLADRLEPIPPLIETTPEQRRLPA